VTVRDDSDVSLLLKMSTPKPGANSSVELLPSNANARALRKEKDAAPKM
jgi:hypothetical protein